MPMEFILLEDFNKRTYRQGESLSVLLSDHKKYLNTAMLNLGTSAQSVTAASLIGRPA